jgi:hypothetical protein
LSLNVRTFATVLQDMEFIGGTINDSP